MGSLFLPTNTQAYYYQEDFDSLATSTSLPSPWVNNTSYYTVNDEEWFTATNSVKFTNTTQRPTLHTFASSTEGLAEVYVNAQGLGNFNSVRWRLAHDGSADDDMTMTFIDQGSSPSTHRFKCGNNATEVEISSDPWQSDTWYTLYIEWRTPTSTNETEFRCGYGGGSLATTFSGWILSTSNPDHIDGVSLVGVLTSGALWFDNFQIQTDADWNGGAENTNTRIISFAPADGVTLPATTTVDFELEAYVNADDLGTVESVGITLHNIDQNYLLGFGSWFGDDIILLADPTVDTAGFYSFATSTMLAQGNYRLEACIKRTFIFGIITAPFSEINDCQSHQFIVGTSTFIGNLSANSFEEFDDFVNGLSATSSEALSKKCNPISFEIRQCSLYLFVPSANSMKETLDSLREGILSRFPWGYFTRLVAIISGDNVASLPSFTVNLQISEAETEQIAFNPSDMLSGGALLIASIEDPHHGQTARDIFEPMVQLVVALSLLFTIVADVAQTHKHHNEDTGGRGKSKLS